MIYNLPAHHHIHYFQTTVYASGHTGADDTVVVEGADQFFGTGCVVNFAYASFH